jgi:hypothetical protein
VGDEDREALLPVLAQGMDRFSAQGAGLLPDRQLLALPAAQARGESVALDANKQIFLSDDDFVARMEALADKSSLRDRTVPKAQRSRSCTLGQWLKACATREEALRNAYVHSDLSMTVMAAKLDLAMARVNQFIARAEAACEPTRDQ